MEFIEQGGILEHVRAVSPYFLERLAALEAYAIVGDARGLGLVGCVEGRLEGEGDRLALDWDIGARIDRKCEALGLIVRPLVNMCVFSPPLVITRPQIDELFDIWRRRFARSAPRSVAEASGNAQCRCRWARGRLRFFATTRRGTRRQPSGDLR